MNICIYGASSELIEQKYKDVVYDLSFNLAKRGHTLVFGGGTHGVMGSCARGFKAGGGKVIGVVPKFFKETIPEVLFTDCDKTFWCDTMYQRKQIMEEQSDAFIIAPGGIGTYDEFFSVLTTKQLDRHTKPIILFGPFGFYDGFDAIFGKAISGNFVKESCLELFGKFDNTFELISYLESDAPFEYLKNKKNLKDG